VNMESSYDNAIIIREAYMTLSTRLHTMDATLSSMTLRVLNLVQERSWSMFGSSLRNDLLKLS
jgi:hypothetical protein